MKIARKKEDPRIKERRVFVMGAGVSASCGLPVARDLLKVSLEQVLGRREYKHDLQGLNKLLEYLFPSFDEELRNYPNIEEFLNQLQNAEAFNNQDFIDSNLWPKKRLESVKLFAERIAAQALWSGVVASKMQPLEDFVRAGLVPGDVIVTFNWDLTLERVFAKYELDGAVSYTFHYKSWDRICLLKPHGSLDWYGTKVGSDSERITRLGEGTYRYNYFAEPLETSLLEERSLIIPPVFHKDFGPTFLKETWKNVFRALTWASQIFFLGYSLPKEDQFARFVFRRALRNNSLKVRDKKKKPLKVVVVNPDDNVTITFSKLVGPEVRKLAFKQAYFEDYVAQFLMWEM